jgi:hypothetical protein
MASRIGADRFKVFHEVFVEFTAKLSRGSPLTGWDPRVSLRSPCRAARSGLKIGVVAR